MTPNIYQLTNAGTAPKFNQAFAQGIVANTFMGELEHDWRSMIVTDGKLRPGPVALWGEHKFYKTLHAAIAEGRTWYYGDHAYFGRGVYFRVTKNALQANGHFRTDGFNDARFAEVSATLRTNKLHDEIKINSARNSRDGFILVCPPSEPLSERSGFAQAEWTAKTIAAIMLHTDRKVIVRQKPKVNVTPAPLLEALQGAWCAVTYTSNVATEAMLGGWPCFTTGDHPANVFGNTDLAKIESPFMPDTLTLHDWAAQLCSQQWTLAEIARGDCWKAIQ